MKELGYWILMTFAIYYLVALLTGSKHPIGALIVGAILSAGITLAFL